MKESTRRGIGLAPYEAPLMRVVALDGERIVVDSLVGDTHLGMFGDGGTNGWNSLGGGSGPGTFYDDGDIAGWNDGSAGGGLGAFDDYDTNGWNSAGGSLAGFGDSGDDQVEWDRDPAE